jgi:NAD(P)H dehydrogenase (quinone)
MRRTLASYDAGVARGELDTQSGDLQTLIGRVPTPAADVIRAAYQLIPSNR